MDLFTAVRRHCVCCRQWICSRQYVGIVSVVGSGSVHGSTSALCLLSAVDLVMTVCRHCVCCRQWILSRQYVGIVSVVGSGSLYVHIAFVVYSGSYDESHKRNVTEQVSLLGWEGVGVLRGGGGGGVDRSLYTHGLIRFLCGHLTALRYGPILLQSVQSSSGLSFSCYRVGSVVSLLSPYKDSSVKRH